MRAQRIITTLALFFALVIFPLWTVAATAPQASVAQGPGDDSRDYIAPGEMCGEVTSCFASIQEAVDRVTLCPVIRDAVCALLQTRDGGESTSRLGPRMP
jgi:hypothetical protein